MKDSKEVEVVEVERQGGYTKDERQSSQEREVGNKRVNEG